MIQINYDQFRPLPPNQISRLIDLSWYDTYFPLKFNNELNPSRSGPFKVSHPYKGPVCYSPQKTPTFLPLFFKSKIAIPNSQILCVLVASICSHFKLLSKIRVAS